MLSNDVQLILEKQIKNVLMVSDERNLIKPKTQCFRTLLKINVGLNLNRSTVKRMNREIISKKI